MHLHLVSTKKPTDKNSSPLGDVPYELLPVFALLLGLAKEKTLPDSACLQRLTSLLQYLNLGLLIGKDFNSSTRPVHIEGRPPASLCLLHG